VPEGRNKVKGHLPSGIKPGGAASQLSRPWRLAPIRATARHPPKVLAISPHIPKDPRDDVRRTLALALRASAVPVGVRGSGVVVVNPGHTSPVVRQAT
jgi:hypothetical protein